MINKFHYYTQNNSLDDKIDDIKFVIKNVPHIYDIMRNKLLSQMFKGTSRLIFQNVLSDNIDSLLKRSLSFEYR